MKFHVLTLFPEMIRNITETSIVGRAVKSNLIDVNTVNMRDFSVNRHMRVDDYPYGGGAGMVIEAEPVYRAIMSVKQHTDTRVIYMTPQAEVLNQTKVEELALEDEIIILCGHYEGIDERVLQECVTDYISIGDYVLTGGELGAAVLIDAVSRFVPGVLSNDESSQFESHQDNLLEYPHYTRPEKWHGHSVPGVLLSGDHRKIEEWRLEKSKERTLERRPDLLKKNFAVHSLWYGSEGFREAAGELTSKLSRYGELYDYNRRKLQKTIKYFGEKDLILIFLNRETDTGESRGEMSPKDEKARSAEKTSGELCGEKPQTGKHSEEENAKQNEAEASMKERFRNLRGKNTHCIFIYGGQEQKQELEAEAEVFSRFLMKKGFRKPEEFMFHMDMNEKEKNMCALKIRSLADNEKF
ncbi:MAG TPA: tRNA (guanosine(37)-N1)-methyltransferase TrmD [Lachnospiraceae bacterium]|nr:tRNA (guanosine(37)-N1)-methyltransferase TrmD [Lachnospiraceae bacterium]